MPHLRRGVEIIGFLNKIEPSDPETHYIFIDSEDGMLLGISENVY